MDHDVAAAEKTHQEAVKELAAASRVTNAALDLEKTAKLEVKSTQKLLKIAQKNQLKSLSAQHKSAFQTAEKTHQEAVKKLAARCRVANAALDREKNAKLEVKSTQKLLKIAQKNQLKSLSAQHKSAFQIAYKLFGDDLRKHGDKISAKRQGELWQSADQAHWLLKAKSLSSTQIL